MMNKLLYYVIYNKVNKMKNDYLIFYIYTTKGTIGLVALS